MRNGQDRFGKCSRGQAASRRVLLCALIALAAVCAFALAGCKYSDVLTQHTEDPTAGIDENAEPIYESVPGAERMDDLVTNTLDDAEDTISEVATLPHYDPNAPDNGPTMQRKKSDQTPHDEEASEGEAEGEADREGQGEGENGGETGTSTDGEKEGEKEGSGDELEGESDEAAISEEGGNGGETVVVDNDGTNENTAKGTVAAVGEYATIAQMLGGAGALAACDKSWLDARNVDGCFKGELDKVQVAFTGDGTAAGSCNVSTLTGTAQPSVVLWDSTSNVPNLSDADRAALEAAGITVQPMPHIGEQNTEDYDVKQAIAAVASVLEGAGGLQYDPTNVLAEYDKFHDNALTGCYNANGGYSYKVTYSSFDKVYQDTPLSGLSDSTATRVVTVFVDDMPVIASSVHVGQSTDTASGTIALAHDGETLDASDGVALSVASATASYQLIDYYLQLAGVMNNAYDGAQPEKGKRYVLTPGTNDVRGDYARPVAGSAFFYSGGDATVQSNWHALGDSGFDTVLAKTSDIADALSASAAKSNGLYNMGKSWRAIVVPTGVAGSWSAGHLDSFLLAPWAFRVQNEDNLSAAESYASNFYSTFLRCSNWKGAVANWDYVKQGG